MDENVLLLRVSRGSQRALEKIIRTYSGYVVAIIHRRGQGYLSLEDEEEAASDVFLSLWQHAGEIQPGHLRPWLASVARNKATDKLRRQHPSLPLEQEASAEDTAWVSLWKQELSQQLRDALATLSPQDQEIFLRFYQHSETAVEIAAAMDIPASTVRTRLSRGRAQLKQTLCQGGLLYE
jgi:RNA polymerase sigma-70 factor (ECF subfamily)